MRFVTKGQWLNEHSGSSRIYFGILAVILGILFILCVNGGLAWGIVIILSGIVLIASKVIPLRRAYSKAKNRKLKKQVSASTNTAPLISPPFFADLFERLDFLKKYGTHCHIDFIIFALFKARLCAIMCVTESNMSDKEKHYVIDAFDTFMYLSLGGWIEKNAPSFTERAEIAESRMLAYDQTLTKFEHTQFSMSLVSCTLYWFIQKGWAKNIDGTLSTIPSKNFDISALSKINRKLERQYATIVDEIDSIVLTYAQINLPALIKFFKDDIS